MSDENEFDELLERVASMMHLSPEGLLRSLGFGLPVDDTTLAVMRLHDCESVWLDLEALSSVNNSDKMLASPIRVLGHLTLVQAIAQGKALEAKRYLRTISGGQNN